MRLFATITILLVPATSVASSPEAGGKVESRFFSTRSLPPPFRVPKQFAEGFQVFQAFGANLPEQVVVRGVVQLGQAQLHLKPQEVDGLCRDLDRVYGRIAKDPLFAGIDSALPICLAEKRPTRGHYFAYYPAKVVEDTPVIVFLHGFGGNLLFYIYILKEEFPKAIILVPSWGASWEDGTMQYLIDMYTDVKGRKAFSVRRPCLVAISAGGPAGFRLYNQQPDRFSSFVSLASFPPLAIVPKLNADLKILMINGRRDSRFPFAHAKSIAAKLEKRLPAYEFHAIDGDHFFLLAKREETFRVIRSFLEKH